MMKINFYAGFFVMLICGCATQSSRLEMEAQKFVDSLVVIIEPMLKESALASWNATATGEDQYYQQYSEVEMLLINVYSNRDDFQKLKKFKENRIKNPVLAREVDILYNQFLANQTDPQLLKKITQIATTVEQRFNTFRGTIDGQKVSNNNIKKILVESNDSGLREKAWKASKQVAGVVEKDFLELVKLRNESARSVGFNDFYEMSLFLGEQDPVEIQRIFDDLEINTRQPFLDAKHEIDQVIAERFGVKIEDLKPWHYADPFFQEAPVTTPVNLDKFYADRDVVKLAREFYDGIGINVDQILANSDLYERAGKYPHAYCTNIDRQKDIRVMMNIQPTESWMSTALHELGHAVYEMNYDPSLPFLLREPAHSFTTEAVAIFFERLSKNPSWMQEMLQLTEEQKEEVSNTTTKMLRLEKLIFARWSLVMLNFERELYSNPDQNLNRLWWNLVEKYQGIKCPANRDLPDYAAKIHICLYPVYYHNYQLGGLLAAQFLHAIAKSQGLESTKEIRFVNNPEIGKYFIKNVFNPGNRFRWDELIIRATGEKLNSKYFVEQL
jgi:peptidyl-dipeptidase A